MFLIICFIMQYCTSNIVLRTHKRPLLKYQVHTVWTPRRSDIDCYRYRYRIIQFARHINVYEFRKSRINLEHRRFDFMLPRLRKPRDNRLTILGCWNVLSVDLTFLRGGVSKPQNESRYVKNENNWNTRHSFKWACCADTCLISAMWLVNTKKFLIEYHFFF